MREEDKVLTLFNCVVFAARAGILSGCASTNLMPADLIVVNANIITVDEGNPRAAAIAVHDGKISAVGERRS